MSPRYSLVLPCYNESGTIPLLVEKYGLALAGRADVEVIFVDNGSTDGSAELLARLASEPDRPWFRTLRVPVNRGYGWGIMCGLRSARGAILGWSHADSQYDPNEVCRAFVALDADPEPERAVLQGRRNGRPLFDRLFTAGMTCFARLQLGVSVSDINAQPKLFPRALFERMTEAPDDFSLDLYLLALAEEHQYRFIHLPVEFGKRHFGEAKGGAGSLALKWKLTKRTVTFIRQLRVRLKERRHAK